MNEDSASRSQADRGDSDRRSRRIPLAAGDEVRSGFFHSIQPPEAVDGHALVPDGRRTSPGRTLQGREGVQAVRHRPAALFAGSSRPHLGVAAADVPISHTGAGKPVLAGAGPSLQRHAHRRACADRAGAAAGGDRRRASPGDGQPRRTGEPVLLAAEREAVSCRCPTDCGRPGSSAAGRARRRSSRPAG